MQAIFTSVIELVFSSVVILWVANGICQVRDSLAVVKAETPDTLAVVEVEIEAPETPAPEIEAPETPAPDTLASVEVETPVTQAPKPAKPKATKPRAPKAPRPKATKTTITQARKALKDGSQVLVDWPTQDQVLVKAIGTKYVSLANGERHELTVLMTWTIS